MNTRHACNFQGQCEKWRRGSYPTQEACEADCQGADNRELLYIINSCDLQATSQLAPSDQAEIIQRLWGFRPSNQRSVNLITALRDENVSSILYWRNLYPQLAAYVDDRYTPFEQLAAELYNIFTADWSRQVATFPLFVTALLEMTRNVIGDIEEETQAPFVLSIDFIERLFYFLVSTQVQLIQPEQVLSMFRWYWPRIQEELS